MPTPAPRPHPQFAPPVSPPGGALPAARCGSCAPLVLSGHAASLSQVRKLRAEHLEFKDRLEEWKDQVCLAAPLAPRAEPPVLVQECNDQAAVLS